MKLFSISKENQNLTSGNIFWKMIKYMIPLAITGVLQLFYTSVDLFSVSQWGGGGSSMSAIGADTPLIHLLVTTFVSFSVGTNVAISNAKGANNVERANKLLHTSIIFALIIGVVMGLLGFFLAKPLLMLMGTNDNIFDRSLTYLKIYYIGVPFIMLYNFISQAMRAVGDSRTPMIILVVTGLVNVVIDFFLVYFARLDVAGVAIATIISQVISAVLAIIFLYRSKSEFLKLDFHKLSIDKDSLMEIVRIGIPAALQTLFFTIPNLLIQSSLYTIVDTGIRNEDIVTGSSAASSVEGYIFTLMDAATVAVLAFTGQNYGAKNEKNIKKIFLYGFLLVMLMWFIPSALCLIFSKQFLGIFIKPSADTIVEDAIRAGQDRLYIMVSTYFLCGFMHVFNSHMRGMKYSTAPAIITCICCTGSRILFLLFLFPLEQFHNITWLYASMPISWVLTIVAGLIATIIVDKKAYKKIENKPI